MQMNGIFFSPAYTSMPYVIKRAVNPRPEVWKCSGMCEDSRTVPHELQFDVDQ